MQCNTSSIDAAYIISGPVTLKRFNMKITFFIFQKKEENEEA
jgi:hypothetical protein